jgi:hypothetical protein
MTSGIFVPKGRSIGGIIAQVTISEQERDELTITEHPVEQGAPISDHAYARPSEVTIRAGWSAAKAGDLSANGNGVYGLLLSWQTALKPFDLHTGKRTYSNMLIQTLTVTTDNHSEFALMADIVCRQVIIVSTQTKQAAISPDTKSQSDPSSNATSKDNGTKSATDVGTGKTGTAPPAQEAGTYPTRSSPPAQVGEGEAGSFTSGPVAAQVGENEAGATPAGTQVENAVSSNSPPGEKFTGQPDNPAVAKIPPPPPTAFRAYAY